MNSQGFICPLCGGALTRNGNSMRCEKGHSYDLAKEGYIYLLPVQKKSAKDPGDSKEMVDARARFLDGGYYGIFADTLAKLCAFSARMQKRPLHIVDMGCGEGYYSRKVADVLREQGLDFELIGMDISKPAVRRAAKLAPENCSYAVASCFDCPIADGWADVVINVFAPFAEDEIKRLLRKGGKLIYAVPGPMHLFGLKKVLYDRPYENPAQQESYEGFRTVEPVDTEGEISAEGQAVQDLFCMTPYYWNTPKDGADRLAGCDRIETPIHFRFLQFIKE